MGEARRWPSLIAGALLIGVSLLLSLRDPMMPGVSLDGSWQLSNEFAAQHGLAFGREYIFTYGPFHYLATRLFDPATFLWVLIYDAMIVAAIFWVPLRNRAMAAVAAIAASILVLQTGFDAFTVLGLFGAFLICLQSRRLWTLLVVALCAPLVLAKLSFGLALAPLLLLADIDRTLARRPAVLTLTFGAAVVVAYLLSGQPLAALVPFVSASLDVILGYGRAMQIPGSKAELVSTVLAAGAAALVVLLLAVAAWRERGWERRDARPLLVAVGHAWVLFVLFKMGFVRHDPHTLIFHLAMPAAVAMAVGALGTPLAGTRGKLALWSVFALLLATSFYWRSFALRPAPDAPTPVARDAGRVLGELGPRLQTGLAWLSGTRFAVMAAERERVERTLARSFPPEVTGSVDAIPWDSGPLILSGLDYRPRPVAQSYSAYTPGLQAADARHLTGPRAPDTLILRVEDIDGRLPTLALGPALPIVGQRYDVVGSDALGLILRRRATPRQMSARRGAEQALALETRVAVPSAPGRLVMARVTLKRSLAGRFVGFLYREPMVSIILHTASGRSVAHRFIPDMAQLGVGVSPLPASWSQGAPVLLDPAWSALGEPVTGVTLSTFGKGWAFAGGTIAFDEIALQPGFGGEMGSLPLLAADLITSDPSHAATFNGSEIFAHAPATLSATITRSLTLRGVAGLHPQPPGTPAGDGVQFRITATDAAGGARTVLDTRIPARGGPAPFSVRLEPGSTLRLETLPGGNTHYDWSYFGHLEVAP